MGAQQSHDVPGWNEYEAAERLQIHFSEMIGSFTLRGQFFNYVEVELPQIFLKAKVQPHRIRVCFLDGHISALLLNHPAWLQDIVTKLLEQCPSLQKFSMKLPKALPYLERFRKILRTTVFPFLEPDAEDDDEGEMEEKKDDDDEAKHVAKKAKTGEDGKATAVAEVDDATAIARMQIKKRKVKMPPLGLEIADDKLIISPDIVHPDTKHKRQIIFVYREQLRTNANNAARTPLERIWNCMIKEVLQVFEPSIEVANISTDCEPDTFQAICSLPALHKMYFQNHVLNDFEVISLTQTLAAPPSTTAKADSTTTTTEAKPAAVAVAADTDTTTKKRKRTDDTDSKESSVKDDGNTKKSDDSNGANLNDNTNSNDTNDDSADNDNDNPTVVDTSNLGVVAASASLKHLNFTNMAMRFHNFTSLCRAMEENQGLKSLTITRLTFHTQDDQTSMVEPLFLLLKRNRHLKWLDCTGQGGPVVVEMDRNNMPIGRPMVADGDNFLELDHEIHGDELGPLGLGMDMPPPGVEGLPILPPPAAAAARAARTAEQEAEDLKQKKQMEVAEVERQRNLERLYVILKESNKTICQLRIGDLQDRQVSRMMMRRHPLPIKVQARLDLNALGLTRIMDQGSACCPSTSVLGKFLVRAKGRAKPEEQEREEKEKAAAKAAAAGAAASSDTTEKASKDAKADTKKNGKSGGTDAKDKAAKDKPQDSASAAPPGAAENNDGAENNNESNTAEETTAVGPKKKPVLLDSLFSLFQEHPTLINLIPVHKGFTVKS